MPVVSHAPGVEIRPALEGGGVLLRSQVVPKMITIIITLAPRGTVGLEIYAVTN